ncbi:MAG TPA: hypothetical protein VF607_05420 [Verrucomicrobiae bacterium]
MRIFIWLGSFLLAITAMGEELRLTFGDMPAGPVTTNYQTALFGTGTPAHWEVVSAEVPSSFGAFAGGNQQTILSKVLKVSSSDLTDERFPLCIYAGNTFQDFSFSTRFKIVGGITEQMAGMAFRYLNASNFYVVRVSALGHNVRFYKVVNGLRSDPIGPAANIPAGEWHKLGVECEGNQIKVLLDDKLVMPPLNDNTFTEGQLGFWTKSDSEAYFYDGVVNFTPRIPLAQQYVNQVLTQQSKLLGLRIYVLDGTNTTKVIASKDLTEIGKAGTDAEWHAINDGATSYAKEKGVDYVTMPLRDRNGEYIGAVRVELDSFLGELENTALTRANITRKMIELLCLSGDQLRK